MFERRIVAADGESVRRSVAYVVRVELLLECGHVKVVMVDGGHTRIVARARFRAWKRAKLLARRRKTTCLAC